MVYLYSMIQDLQWFLDREGSYILRGTTEVFIKDKEVAKKLHGVQSKGYTFSVKPRVHRAPQEECQSCSA